MAIKEQVDARKTRLGRAAALRLARGVQRIVVAKGQRVTEFDMRRPPDEDTLLTALLGPTGNLRAPAARIGQTLLVGFNEQQYRALLAR